MNRNDFLKKLGFGALAVAIAPTVVAKKEIIANGYTEPLDSFYCTDGISTFSHPKYHYGEIFYFNGGEYMITAVPYPLGGKRYQLTPLSPDTNFGKSLMADEASLNTAFIRR